MACAGISRGPATRCTWDFENVHDLFGSITNGCGFCEVKRENIEARNDTISGVLNLMLEEGHLIRRRKGKQKVL